ncbi:acidic repeat-containing protein [Gryllus bimaculatus]|nr:acidic repeat-containing protein [Gryllus bimaculatus]
MDSSFLTFSPKALSKKKLNGNIVQGPVKSRILRSKVCPLQDARCSPSSLYNIKNNRRESTESKKSSVLEDSVVLISEKINSRSTPHVPKLFNTDQERTASTLISKNVKSGEIQRAANDKFDEILSWLNELYTAHERKRFSSPWSTSNSSSVVECSPVSSNPPKLGTENTSKNRISETSSDESSKSRQQNNFLSSDYNCNSQEFENTDNFKGVIPESSDDASEIQGKVRRKKVCLNFSDSECEDGSSNWSQTSSIGNKSDLISKKSDKDSKSLPCSEQGSNLSHSSLGKKKTDSVSSKSSEDSFKLSLPRSRRKNVDLISNKSSEISLKLSLPRSSDDGGSCSRTSYHSDESIISVSSADRIISNLYAKNWNKESVLTPVVQKRKTVTKNPNSEIDTGSIDATLSQLYGKNWDEEKILTPLLNRRKVRKGKENTPPVNKKEVNAKRPFLTPKTQVPHPGINAPKTCPLKTGVSKIKQTFETLSFLRSLSVCSPKKSNPEALLYKKDFKKKKDELCSRLFKLFNAEVFENKVCNTADRVRDTLIHELCHAASWIIDGVKSGHGAVWQAWTKRATARFPELPRIGRCHSYSIETKYTYKCKNCGYSFGRHSKSLDLQRKRCGYCYGEFDLLVNKKPRSTKTASSGVQSSPKTPRAVSGFALYVKENYKTTKEKNSGLKHADIMKLLGTQFSEVAHFQLRRFENQSIDKSNELFHCDELF